MENQELTNVEIAKHLLSDQQAYGHQTIQLIAERLAEVDDVRIYWDAWFRGAKGKDLEAAAKGVAYKPKNERENENNRIIFMDGYYDVRDYDTKSELIFATLDSANDIDLNNDLVDMVVMIYNTKGLAHVDTYLMDSSLCTQDDREYIMEALYAWENPNKETEKSIEELALDYASGSVDGIIEGELFWEDKSEVLEKLMNTDNVRDNISKWVKVQNYSTIGDGIYQEIYDQISEFMEHEYNRVNVWNANTHQNEIANVEHILFELINKLPIDKPENFEDILEFVMADIMECTTPGEYSDSDVAIGFRRFLESKSMNQVM